MLPHVFYDIQKGSSKLGMVAHDLILVPRRQRQNNQEFEIGLVSMVHLRPAWATYNPVSDLLF